uniref:Uncharacterized protein n=1 Tax=Lepeophtheirus salmonis TaxID=72036 RepID=A0A0K2TB40_LEPSM
MMKLTESRFSICSFTKISLILIIKVCKVSVDSIFFL